MTPKLFVQELRSLDFENSFNPYSQCCPVHDWPDAPHRRAAALEMLIEEASKTEVDAIWIGRDLGYRGGRRTGLALTDDAHVGEHVGRWGVTADRATKGEIVRERTAAFVWGTLAQISAAVFLWNVFPLHPHNPGDPFSNRAHNARERQAGEEVFGELVKLLSPRRLIAIGNDAGRTADRYCSRSEVFRVRHPSYGGQTEFRRQIGDLYGVG